jgi:hypothetical protein
MRFIAALLGCVAVALTVAGCELTADKQYMNEGAGVELSYPGLPEATQRQQIYIDEICQQAGYPKTDSVNSASSCMDSSGWDAFVLAGINDINRRCDGYLTWLDARRRDRAPVLKELLAVNGATSAILDASGVGSGTLNIVSAALALAGATYENWNSRLLLAINQSTVQDIVYSRQAQFIDENGGKHISSRPAAIYLLRNYLRLCMPTTIEADINTSMTLVQRGNPMDAKNNPVVRTINVTPLTAKQKIGQQQKEHPRPTPKEIPGYADIIENYDTKVKVFTPALVKPALERLCVQNVDAVGKDTVPLVQVYQMENGKTPTGKLTLSDVQSLKGKSDCPLGRLNYFEAHGMPAGLVTKGNIDLLNAGLPKDDQINETPPPSLDDLRAKYLPKVRSGPVADHLTLKAPQLAGQFTRDLITGLRTLQKNAKTSTPGTNNTTNTNAPPNTNR